MKPLLGEQQGETGESDYSSSQLASCSLLHLPAASLLLLAPLRLLLKTTYVSPHLTLSKPYVFQGLPLLVYTLPQSLRFLGGMLPSPCCGLSSEASVRRGHRGNMRVCPGQRETRLLYCKQQRRVPRTIYGILAVSLMDYSNHPTNRSPRFPFHQTADITICLYMPGRVPVPYINKNKIQPQRCVNHLIWSLTWSWTVVPLSSFPPRCCRLLVYMSSSC